MAAELSSGQVNKGLMIENADKNKKPRTCKHMCWIREVDLKSEVCPAVCESEHQRINWTRLHL